MSVPAVPPAAVELERRLGLLDAASIVVGIVIGGGIFLVPGLVARSLPAAHAILAAWLCAGLLSFLGALAMAELGAMLPATGGQYVFLREAYGPLLAFLCGWSYFLVSASAGIAWLGVSFSLYLSYLIPVSALAQKLVALVLIALLAAANYRGVTLGAMVQKGFTIAKLAGLALLILSALLVRAVSTPLAVPGPPLRPGAFGVALIACVMAYDGWANVASVAGEIRHPERNVVRALAAGVFLCVVVYVSANIAFLHTLGPVGLAASARPGAETAERTLGPVGGTLVAFLILISIVGSMNGWLLTLPRMYFAQARDGLFFRRFGSVHPRYHTPGFSILMQFAWAAVLLVTGSFEVLIDYAMFAIWLFYVLTTAAVIVLRIRQPERPRPYRMWGYPVTPLLFIATALWFLANMLSERPGPSFAALGIVLSGVPVYLYWARRSP